MVLKARQIRRPLIVNYVPIVPGSNPNTPVISPQPPTKVGGHQPTWGSHRHPPKIGTSPGPSPSPSSLPGVAGGGSAGTPGYLSPIEWEAGYFGYPLSLWASRGSGRDLLYIMRTVHAQNADLPVGEVGNTISPRWGYAFCVRSQAGIKPRHHFREDEPLSLTFMGYGSQEVPDFGHDNVDANGFRREMETGRWAMLIGNTEICHFEQIVKVADGHYEVYGLQRGASGEYLYQWPQDTPVLIVDTRLNELQSGLDYADWAFRSRHIPDVFYENVTFQARIRAFFQAVDLNGVVAPPDEGWNGELGETFENRAGAKEHASGMYPPLNEILCDRAPMPACQALRKGVGTDWDRRSWYGSGYGVNFDWIIEFPPFPDDSSGIGSRVAYDEVETVGQPFGPPADPWDRFFGPTDKPFVQWVGPTSEVVGQTYRLYIMANISEDPRVDTPVRTIDIVFDGTEIEWPAFLYTAVDQVTDGTDAAGNTIAFWVAVEGRPTHFCRPRLVDKVGNSWSPQRDPTYDVVPS